MKKAIVLISFCLSSCSLDSLMFWSDAEPVSKDDASDHTQSDQPAEADDNTDDDDNQTFKLELNLAKLAARVDELEARLRRQGEHFHVLRKGLMTGLIPNEWQDDAAPNATTATKAWSAHSAEQTPNTNHNLAADGQLPIDMSGERDSGQPGSSSALPKGPGSQVDNGQMSAEKRRQYEEKLAKANEHFRAGDYGKAILAYTEIGQDYPDDATKGSHLLWIGASWYRLKDFQAARKHLKDLIDRYKSSPWIPEAELFLAKADFRDGFMERSMNSLKDIIRKYSKDNVAIRAKEELKRIEESL